MADRDNDGSGQRKPESQVEIFATAILVIALIVIATGEQSDCPTPEIFDVNPQSEQEKRIQSLNYDGKNDDHRKLLMLGVWIALLQLYATLATIWVAIWLKLLFE